MDKGLQNVRSVVQRSFALRLPHRFGLVQDMPNDFGLRYGVDQVLPFFQKRFRGNGVQRLNTIRIWIWIWIWIWSWIGGTCVAFAFAFAVAVAVAVAVVVCVISTSCNILVVIVVIVLLLVPMVWCVISANIVTIRTTCEIVCVFFTNTKAPTPTLLHYTTRHDKKPTNQPCVSWLTKGPTTNNK